MPTMYNKPLLQKKISYFLSKHKRRQALVDDWSRRCWLINDTRRYDVPQIDTYRLECPWQNADSMIYFSFFVGPQLAGRNRPPPKQTQGKAVWALLGARRVGLDADRIQTRLSIIPQTMHYRDISR